jgi:YVTN family beta-propeller protein
MYQQRRTDTRSLTRPDGTKVYVANNGNGITAGTVSVIATATNTVVGSR